MLLFDLHGTAQVSRNEELTIRFWRPTEKETAPSRLILPVAWRIWIREKQFKQATIIIMKQRWRLPSVLARKARNWFLPHLQAVLRLLGVVGGAINIYFLARIQNWSLFFSLGNTWTPAGDNHKRSPREILSMPGLSTSSFSSVLRYWESEVKYTCFRHDERSSITANWHFFLPHVLFRVFT